MIFCITRHVQEAKPGQRRFGCNCGDRVWHAEQPFLLVAEKTQADYFAWLASEGATPLPWEIGWMRRNPCRYFEVALD